MTENFANIYRTCEKKIKLKQRKSENVWITTEIMELCKEKDKLWHRCKADPGSNILKEEFRSLQIKSQQK